VSRSLSSLEVSSYYFRDLPGLMALEYKAGPKYSFKRTEALTDSTVPCLPSDGSGTPVHSMTAFFGTW